MSERTEDGRTVQYLTFHMAGELHAVELLRVREIIRLGELTVVPTAPRVVRGVINLRGCVVPVLDPCIRYGLAPMVAGERACIVIVELLRAEGALDLGIMVDRVDAVVALDRAEVEPVPEFGTGRRAGYLLGMGRIGERLALILDVERFLDEDEDAHDWTPEPGVAA